jgi:hypothetical protein
LAPQCDLTEEMQGICLIAPFLMRTGERQRPLGKAVRFLQTTGQQLRFPEGDTAECLVDYHFHCNRLFQRLRQPVTMKHSE